MSEAHQRIAELRAQDRVRGVFRVARKTFPLSRSGKHFLALTLADRTGEIEARAFDDAERLEQRCPASGYVRVEALADVYKGRLELKLAEIEQVAESEIDPADFVACSRYEPRAMIAQVRALVGQVHNPFVKELLFSFLDDPQIGPAFLLAPAAKSVHHAFVSGLLEHTLSVLQLGWRMCDHYPQLDRDLVTAGCLLHDLAKTTELRAEGGIEYTQQGRLVGHLLTMCQWIHERARRIPGFPEQLEWNLVHLVAAHHGELEHGSPKEPSTLEAVVVHALDELDSRLSSFGLHFARDKGQGAWTEWSRLYDRPLFKGPSWDGKPLPPDLRRFRGRGVYEPEPPKESQPEPVVLEGREPPVALPGPAPQESAAQASAPKRPAVWERPEPRLREYNYRYPERAYAPPVAPRGPRPTEPVLPLPEPPDAAQKPAGPVPLDLFKIR